MNTRQPASASKATSATQPAPDQASTITTGCVGPLRVDSTALMGGQRVLEIVHLGEVYRLQTTRFGKLILTK
jgi:hemin uptake protein HemP